MKLSEGLDAGGAQVMRALDEMARAACKENNTTLVWQLVNAQHSIDRTIRHAERNFEHRQRPV